MTVLPEDDEGTKDSRLFWPQEDGQKNSVRQSSPGWQSNFLSSIVIVHFYPVKLSRCLITQGIQMFTSGYRNVNFDGRGGKDAGEDQEGEERWAVRYSEGSMLNSVLKKREKYLGLLKPTS